MAEDQEPTRAESPAIHEAAVLLDRATDLKDEAYSSGDSSLLERAVAEFDDLHRRYGGSAEDTSLTRILAIGSYNRSGAVWSLGRTSEAREGFAGLAERYGDDLDSELRKVGRFAGLRLKLLISVPEPPQYVLDLAERSSAADGGTKVAGDPREIERAEAILGSHRRATDILARFRATASLFALFLRSFELEAYELLTGGDWTAATGLEHHTVSVSSAQPNNIERQLMDAFPDPPVVVAVANRLSMFEKSWLAPRLFLPDESWRDMIGVLVRAAAVTVIQIGSLSPGVRWELADRSRWCPQPNRDRLRWR